MTGAQTCIFCEIVAGVRGAEVVLDDPVAVAFLDHRPLFPGHVLVVPRRHLVTLADLPSALVGDLFRTVQRLAVAVEEALAAQGTFVAVNNRVSQSVPHFHVHVVPRRKGDGMRGFFWPRTDYDDAAHRSRTAEAIRRRLADGEHGR